ncbi:MAG: hypothetical protein ACYCO9_12940 [Streptosporangiaceae bacterium]
MVCGRRAPIPTVLAVVAAAGMALAGCGSAGVTNAPGPGHPSVASLIRSMKAGIASARSVRVSGDLPIHGHSVAMNIVMFWSGDMSGTIRVGSTTTKLLRVNGTTYEYVTNKFFNAIRASQHIPASACALMCGKYLKVPAAGFSNFSLRHFAASTQREMPVPSAVPHIRSVTYRGQAAYEISDYGLRIYLAASGTHYLLGLVDHKLGTVNFSDWNTVPPVSPPPASKIFAAG